MFGGCASIMRSPPLWEGTLSLCDGFMSMEATMAVDPDASEWKLLQDYFAALSDHDPAQEQQPLDAIFDASVRRRFGDWIARSAAKSRSRKAGV
jgi:hypothetical protein